ncbi:hypothetical protein PRZ48_004416 [Zasmidium cellare]|uniref:Uncharacterized protein n=1 Tax=Zasmidium cellare TaxID=395010 RepID=A0ABR0EQH9_ZASCE|nr:hypothetical protein PRZ48_004416 [Zasmidium cellare]
MRVVSSGQRQSGVKAVLEHIGVPLLCLTVTALFTGLFFSTYTQDSYDYSTSSSYLTSTSSTGTPATGLFYCDAGGDVIYPWESSRNQYWNPNLWLTITLASGSLTFTQAKAIDIIWDLVVGRGGQMLLCVLAYPPMRKSLLTALERHSMHMPVVASLAFEHFSVVSWWATTRELFRGWSWRLFGYLWMIIYLLIFGTIVSAMTGYQANMRPYYSEQNSGNLMAYSNVEGLRGVKVTDGQRVGLQPDVLALSIESDPTWPLYQYYMVSSEYCMENQYGSQIRSNKTSGVLTAANSSYSGYSGYQYNSDGTVDSTKQINSSFYIDWTKNKNLSDQYQSQYSDYSGYTSSSNYYSLEAIIINCTSSNITLSNHTYELKEPVLSFESSSLQAYYRDGSGKLLNQTWLELNSQCQVLQTYQWGFSSLLLFTFCILTILFFVALLALHIDIWRNSQTNRINQKFSLYRDILDFAHQLRTEIGSKVEDMPPKDLDQSVAAQADFVTVAAYEYPQSRAQERRSRRKPKQPFNFRTDSMPRLRKMGSELKAGHEYSMGEMKRSLGMTYGPVRKQTADSIDFSV